MHHTVKNNNNVVVGLTKLRCCAVALLRVALRCCEAAGRGRNQECVKG